MTKKTGTFTARRQVAILISTFGLSAGPALEAGQTRILVHPFQKLTESQDPSSFLLNHPGKTLDAQTNIGDLLRSSGLGEGIDIQKRQLRSFQLFNNALIASDAYLFSVNGIKLCQFEVKAHRTFDGALTVMGDIPSITPTHDFQMSDWPTVAATVETILASEYNPNPFTTVKNRSHEACLWSDGDELIPVWRLSLQFGNLLYSAIASESYVYEFLPQHFHAAEGSAQVYPNNILDETKQAFSFPISDSGYLENDYFVTVLDSPQYSYAYASDFNFVFNDGTSEFEETSVFTNSNRALQWLQSMGYENFGDKPIRLIVHASFSGDTNNALYQPSNDYSMIYVGDGDGIILDNLSTDADVVSHELGHHVVYQTIKNISGESLVVHEGLADFLTFARTGNACLGESICPETSGICSLPQQCLRTAENDLKLTSPDLPPQPHLRSQFLSGLLWDLREIDGIPADDLTRMLLKAIELFVSNSGYQHVILGLMVIDDAEYSGQYCSKIYDRAIARGLSAQLEGFACNSVSSLANQGGLSSVTEDSSTSGSTGAAAQTRSSSKKPLCGSVGGKNNHPAALILVLLLPAVIWLRRLFN